MATSVGDLLRAIADEAVLRTATAEQASDAVGAIEQLGRALGRLARDGLDPDGGDRRAALVADLAESCSAVRLATPETRGRLTELAAATADVIGQLPRAGGDDERWAVAVEVSDVVRMVCAHAAASGLGRSDELAWAHTTARAITVAALVDPAPPQDSAVLDRPIPRAWFEPGLAPVDAAAELLRLVAYRLDRARVGFAPSATLAEVIAVSRAAEAAAGYAALVATGHALAPAEVAAAAIWRDVRAQLRPYQLLRPRAHEHDGLRPVALRAHTALREAFGPPASLDPRAVDRRTAAGLLAAVDVVPRIADQLRHRVEHLADSGHLQTLASRLPYREDRPIETILRKQPVIADRFDVAKALDRLDLAGTLAAEVAVELHASRGRPAVAEPQSASLAAHAARVDAARSTDPRIDYLLAEIAGERTAQTMDRCDEPRLEDQELESAAAGRFSFVESEAE